MLTNNVWKNIKQETKLNIAS